MGYSSYVEEQEFFMPKNNFSKLLSKIKEYDDINIDDFSLIETASLDTIWDFFTACYIDLELDLEGNINGLNIEYGKNYHLENVFNFIAPFVTQNSYISMVGEEGEKWRYIFKNNKCHTVSPIITWPEV